MVKRAQKSHYRRRVARYRSRPAPPITAMIGVMGCIAAFVVVVIAEACVVTTGGTGTVGCWAGVEGMAGQGSPPIALWRGSDLSARCRV